VKGLRSALSRMLGMQDTGSVGSVDPTGRRGSTKCRATTDRFCTAAELRVYSKIFRDVSAV